MSLLVFGLLEIFPFSFACVIITALGGEKLLIFGVSPQEESLPNWHSILLSLSQGPFPRQKDPVSILIVLTAHGEGVDWM